MSVDFFHDESCRRFCKAVGFSVEPSVDAIWILPGQRELSADDWDDVFTYLGAANILVWHVSDGGAYSPRIKAHRRALGAWKELSRNLLRVSEIEECSGRAKHYSDVALIDRESCSDLARFSSRSTFGIDSAMSFLSCSGGAQDVATCFSACEDVFFRRQSLSAIQRQGEIDNALSRYVSCSLQRGGAPCVVFRDSDSMLLIAVIGLGVLANARPVASLSGHKRMQERSDRGFDLAIYA